MRCAALRMRVAAQLSLVAPQLSSRRVLDMQAVAANQRQQLQDLRQQRGRLEAARADAAVQLREADAQLRAAHEARLLQRQQLLQQAGLQVRA